MNQSCLVCSTIKKMGHKNTQSNCTHKWATVPHNLLEMCYNGVTRVILYRAEYCTGQNIAYQIQQLAPLTACREIKPPVHQAGWKTLSCLREEQFFHQLDCIPWYGTDAALLLTESGLLETTQHTLPHVEWYKYWKKLYARHSFWRDAQQQWPLQAHRLTALFSSWNHPELTLCYWPASITWVY